MVLDWRGELVSSAHWSTLHQRIEPLSAAQAAELLGLIPERRTLFARSFVAMVQGRPHLISLQPILPSSGSTAPAGRLLFARSLDGPDNALPRQALALQHYRMEPVRPLPSAPLGPLAIAVRTPRLDGLQPLQITAERAASERHNALRGLLLLLALDGVVLAQLLLTLRRRRRAAPEPGAAAGRSTVAAGHGAARQHRSADRAAHWPWPAGGAGAAGAAGGEHCRRSTSAISP
jgi:hypothetical protein